MRGRDRISLTGVRAVGYHGVLEHERREGQEFLVDVELDVDLALAARTDDLNRTVNYAEVAAQIVAILTGPPHQLIETVAGQIAERVLEHPLVEAVEVVVHKPQAPVGVPFGDVSVRLCRRRDVPVVIGVGANLAEPERTVRAATARLRRVPGLRQIRSSALYRTDPVGGPEQDRYVNAVLTARTSRLPAALLEALHRVEEEFGRVREVHWGPRTLDLDLIQYGVPGTPAEYRSQRAELTLPHPRAAQRAFVLVPWQQVDPDAVLRVEDQLVPIDQAVGQVDASGIDRIDGS